MRQGSGLRLGEQVDMLGHEDIGVESEAVRLPGLFEDLRKSVLRFRALEKGKTSITTEGDEVELACALSPFEADGHGLDFIGGGWKMRLSFARMPTHAMRP